MRAGFAGLTGTPARSRDVEPVFSVQPPRRFTSAPPCASAGRIHQRYSASAFSHGLQDLRAASTPYTLGQYGGFHFCPGVYFPGGKVAFNASRRLVRCASLPTYADRTRSGRHFCSPARFSNPPLPIEFAIPRAMARLLGSFQPWRKAASMTGCIMVNHARFCISTDSGLCRNLSIPSRHQGFV